VAQATLKILEGLAAGGELRLDGELVLGRAEPGAASLGQDPELSRRHARVFTPDGQRFVLEDLGSTNGTYLNGWKIPTPQALNAGDRIQLGGSVLEVGGLAIDARPAEGGSPGLTMVGPVVTLAEAAPAVLKAHGVEKSYGDLTVLRGVDLEIQAGEIVGLLGPNGAGKTSFVSIVAGLRSADAGEVSIAGVDALRNSREARRHLGLAPQDLGVYATLTVRRNLEFFGEINGLSGAALKERVEEVGEALSLVPKFDALAGTLSGGQQRRLHTGMALLHQPALCILDEPTVGADVRTRQEILELVKRLAEEGHAVCYSTHYLPEIEELGATVAILEGGRIIARGLIAELIAQHGQQALELRFDGPAPNLDLGELSSSASVDGSVIRIQTDDPPRAAAAMMGRLGRAGLRLKEVEMIRPSLESVYLALTERRYQGERETPRDPSLLSLPAPQPGALIAAATQ
jgi:ABC-type multidrug transport system ATPase subunit